MQKNDCKILWYMTCLEERKLTDMNNSGMKILYYTWGENSKEDIMYTFHKMNLDATEWACKLNDYDNDLEFCKQFKKQIEEGKYNIVFSFDFIPAISRCIKDMNEQYDVELIYISWIYDCPHMTLFSPYAMYEKNYIFVFDKIQYNKLRGLGYANVHYMPLAVNTDRLNGQLALPDRIGQGNIGVSFVGSLYEKNFYDRINYLPDYIYGYIEGMIEVQKKIYGYNIIEMLLKDEIIDEVSKYVSVPLGEGYKIGLREVFADMINAKITSEERIRMLKKVSEVYGLILCTGSDKNLVPQATYKGYVSYEEEMPRIFRDSAININITLRSIESGIPLRALDIMGAGGFLLSNYQAELAEYFEDEKEIVLFGDEEDLLDKIGYYLEHDDLRYRIAYNGWKKVQEHFRYEYVVAKIFDIIKNVKGK